MVDDVRGEMDFSKVIFLLLVKIHSASGVDSDQYIALVETYWDTMYPYHKDNPLDLGDAQRNYDTVIKTPEEYKGKKPALKDAQMNLARAKFRGLMVLAETKNLLLTRVSRDEVWELPEDTDEVET